MVPYHQKSEATEVMTAIEAQKTQRGYNFFDKLL